MRYPVDGREAAPTPEDRKVSYGPAGSPSAGLGGGCAVPPSLGIEAPMEKGPPPVETTALLGRGTVFEGKLHFEGIVRIDGTFRGEIRSDSQLIIGEGAEIHAEIDVGMLVVRGGAIFGNIRAHQSVDVFAPGRILGNIQTPSLFIERGVEFQGTCRMTGPDQAPSGEE